LTRPRREITNWVWGVGGVRGWGWGGGGGRGGGVGGLLGCLGFGVFGVGSVAHPDLVRILPSWVRTVKALHLLEPYSIDGFPPV